MADAGFSSNSSSTFDLTLLFGPQTPDKTSCLPLQCSSKNVASICTDDVFRDNPACGLRDIALQVISNLKQNKQAVINDEFRLRATRKSLVDTVKKKVPSCRVQLLKVIPKYGFQQLMWCQQFHHAKNEAFKPAKEESLIKQWFDESLQNIDYTSGYVDNPTENEGFEVKNWCMPLNIKSHFKLEFPALLFQWEGAITETLELYSQLETLCSVWASRNTCGYIFFICDGKNVAKGLLSSSGEDSHIKRCLQNLAEKINHPVYAIKLVNVKDTERFCIPPQPGILAFLQYGHLLDLYCKNTCYIFDTLDHMKMAETAGVRHLKLSTVLKSPDVIFKGHGFTPSVPAVIRNLVMEKPDYDDNSNQTFSAASLFDLRHQGTGKCVSRTFQNGLEEHVFFSNEDNFCKFYERISVHATPIDEAGNKIKTSTVSSEKEPNQCEKRKVPYNELEDNRPSWMRKRIKRENTLKSSRPTSSLTKRDSTGSESGGWRSSKTVYIMSDKELLDMARQVLEQAAQKDITPKTDETNPG